MLPRKPTQLLPGKRKELKSLRETPEFDGELIGFRNWGLDGDYNLVSPIRGTRWPHSPEKARFLTATDFDYEDQEGEGGWYGYYSLDECQTHEFYNWDKLQLSGAIVAWGITYLYPVGFRAEYAKVIAITFEEKWPKPFLAALKVVADMYDASLILKENLETHAEEFGTIINEEIYENV